jgi:Kef-type K+ transport system membrane component KefB
MPKGARLVLNLSERIEHVTVSLLLPVFFALTGLRTNIRVVSGWEMWFYFVLIFTVAVVGKLGGSMISARLTGMSWREAGALGVLLNTRGLIELVILNIGLDMGVISSALFSMVVLMALITTFMTSPLLALIYPTELFTRDS